MKIDKDSSQPSLQKRRFQAIKEEVSVLTAARDLVTEVAGVLQQKGNEWRGTCPVCANGTHSGAFEVNAEKNYWYCFACGEGGDVIELAYRSGFATRTEAVAWLSFTYGVVLPERPEQWFHKQSRQERIREQLDEVRRNSYCRRLFKYLILPGLEGMEDEQERKKEIEACWQEMKHMPLHTHRWGSSGSADG